MTSSVNAAARGCAAVILAGGRSSRMGRNKAYLRFKGQTLLRHMCDVVANAGAEAVYISSADHIADEVPGRGPLSGVHASLRHVMCHHRQVAFAPVDMPGLTPALIRRLMNAPANYALVTYASHKAPFRLNVDQQWLALAERFLTKEKDVSLGRFQSKIPNQLTLAVQGGDALGFVNANTADQWREFKKGNTSCAVS